MNHGSSFLGVRRQLCIVAVLAALLPSDLHAADASEILAATGIRGGFVVHVGCGDGQLTVALRASSGFQVHGLDRGVANVAKARARVRELGTYGEVSIDRLVGTRLPYIDGLANLVVCEDLAAAGISLDEIRRVLVPGGVAYTRSSRDSDEWILTRKPRPDAIDEWTHFLHDASGNAVAHDSVVGPPRRLQWIGSPRWSRHHDRMASMSALVASDGRLFYIMDEGSRVSIQLPPHWALIARDAFNGTILWKRDVPTWHNHLWPLKSGPTQLARRLIALEGEVYVTLGFRAPLTALDAVTGETIRTYEGSQATEEVIATGGRLFALVNDGEPELAAFEAVHNVGDQQRVANEFLWNEQPRRIAAFGPESGKLLWQRDTRVAPLTLCADEERVVYHDGEKVVALAPSSGDVLWTSERLGRRRNVTMNFGPRVVLHDKVVLFAGGDRKMAALSIDDGRVLWSAPHAKSAYASPEDLLVVGGLVWSAPTTSTKDSGVFTGHNLLTGAIEKQFPPDVDTYWFHHRCYMAKATDRFLLPSRTGIEFVDPEKETWQIHHWARGGCLYGIMPCNGLVYAPPHDCACYPEAKLFGFNALAPATTSRAPAGDDEQRLERGPATEIAVGTEEDDDWPTYRHDMLRSGSTAKKLPATLAPSWQVDIGGRISSPVIAAGRLYVAEIDAHALHALDAVTGAAVWTRTVGGRIDSPPTVWQGRVLFGSADGSVYCLRATDGELVWRFRAAPRDLRLMAFEQLESVWPVHGSVLVQEGSVFFAAGRSNFLDGGLRFFRLDAKTGALQSETTIDHRDPETGEDVQNKLQILNMTAGLPDVLSGDGRWVYMRSQQYDRDGRRPQIGPHSGQPAEQGSVQAGEGGHLFAPMGFLDGSWFHRSYWVYGRSFAGGHAGYYQAGKYAPSGRILVFDDDDVWGFGRKPQYYRWTTTLEHQLFSTSKKPPELATGSSRRRAAPTSASVVSFENTKSIDPTGKPIVVEAWAKPSKPNGVVLAHGGPAHGYSLFLKKSQPCFAVRISDSLHVVRAKRRTGGDWVHLVGMLTADGKLKIFVDGELAGTAKAPGLVAAKPAQSLEIGADLGSGVSDAYKSPATFTGAIDEVRVYHGALSDDEIRQRVTSLGRAPAKDATLVLSCSFDAVDGKDTSGHGNHGTAVNVGTTKGRFGNALTFKARASRGGGSFVEHHWTSDVPLLVRAMVLAGDTLVIAGPPDPFDEEKSFQRIVARDETISAELLAHEAAVDGRKGAILQVVTAADGQRVAQYRLPAPPVWDGMAAANGRLYLSTTDGRVRCWAER